MSGAALGCAVKYNKPDMEVSPTLLNQGILPYTTFGGSAPMSYINYPASQTGRQVTPPASEVNAGYGCIPCRFKDWESSRAADKRSLESTTALIPVDQDAATARQPIFKFSKAKAQASCVKNIKVQVRYFGSAACNGISTPPGHFCSSGNIQPQTCPGISETNNGVTFSGGGNIAGEYTFPVCQGNEYAYESVSVSWSPIILDVKGNGIHVSREMDKAIYFDIKGKGKKALIDWPTNTDEVAFLVRPNKAGQVESIKELFGDNVSKNGFEALKKYDSNHDGQLNQYDKSFKSLRLWFDRNRNAVSEPEEIVTLESQGVESIDLRYSKPMYENVDGRTLISVYVNSKLNRVLNIVDYYFVEYSKPKQ